VANKDVNLTITARNAATKTIKSVGDALKDMRTAQKQANAENTGGTQSVKNMAGAYGELVGQVRRLKAIADVSKNVNSAAAAVERLGAANKNLATDQKKVADNLAKAKVETDAVRASQKGVNAELTAQNAALAEAKALKTQMKKDLVQEERLYKKISTAAAKAQQGDGFGQPAIKSAELFQADNVGDQRIALMKVQATIDNLTNSTKKLKTEQSALTTTSSKATAAETKLNGEYTKLTGTLQANTRALAEGRAELDRIQDAAARLGVAGGMGDLVANQEKLKVATREVTAEMERLGSVQAALNRFDAGGANFTDPKTAAAIKAQREEINKARVAYELLTAEHTRLSASARAVLAPQSAAAKAAREVGNAAAAAKRELADQIEVMNRIPGSAGNIGKSLNGLFRGYNTEGRTALSLTQRIRAEVISLALAYGGLHEAIRLMSEVVDAYRTMEAATNRIMVVVEGDTRRTADELGFLSRMASRLGVDFGVLSDEYSKFAVAANSAGYSMESTRKIFTAVSEAGRVNKLSTEQMSGAFLAFTQIIQKGKFSAEEVTRQLSERLPGATAILAKAMFGSADAVDQLFDAMKKGELLATEENLLKYADGLNEKFGPQLSKSLRTTTTLIGQFTNELFQAKLRIGEGGFIDALNVALEEMITYFKSREGRDFFLAIGAGMGKVVEMVPFLVQNFDTIINLIKTFVAFKMAQWLFNTALAFTALGRETLKMRTMMGLAVTSMKTGEGAMYSLGRAAHATRAALLAIPGGLAIAAITTGISYLMGNWSAGVTEINSGVDEHQRIMGEILKAYEDAKDKAGEWKEALPDTVDGEDLAANFVRQLATAERDFTDLVNNGFQVGLSRKNFFSDISGQVRDEIFAMTAELKKTGDLDAYITKLEELAATTANLKMREVVIGLIDTAQEAKSSSERMGEAAVAANEYGVEIDGVAEAAEKFGRTLEDMTVAAEANVAALDDSGEKAEKYAELMDEVGSKIKGVAEELELLSEIKALDEMLVQLVANANGLDEVAAAFLRVRAAQDQLRTDAIVVPSADSFESEYVRRAAAGSGSKEEELVRAVTALAEKMGVAAEDLLTAISYETGGDPTNTRAGSNNVTSQGKHFGLIQFGDGPGAAGERYGVTRDSSITEQVIAAGNYLSDAGIKAGDGLKRIYAAINTGTPDGGGRTDENNGGAPGTSDEKVDNQMEGHRNRAKGLLAAYGGLVQEVEDLAEAEKDAAEDRAKVLEDGRASTAETIAEGAFAIEQQDLINAGKDRQAAIEDAIRSAKAEDPAISEAELASITAQTAALYDKENALTAEEARKKKIEEVDKALNDLESQRNSLIQQRDALKAQGDIAGANEIDSEIVAITAALDAAYDAAVKFWEALGGEGSLAAIEALKASKLEIVATGQAALFTAEELNTSIADGLTSTLSAGMSKLAQYFTDFQAYQEEGVSVFQAMRTAFLQFAADFLIKIGQMIVKQLILNALKSALGGATGGVGGLIAGAIGKVLHTGGIAGAAGGTSRSVSPANYIGASRYHGGGIAGLKPDEVPAILQKGEEVLTANDDRHRKNGGGKNGTRPMRIVNAIDGPSFLEAALGDTAGEEIFINKVRSMKSAIKAALEV
jgi:tape measure domain-containing protein